jgi:hypothetical protein
LRVTKNGVTTTIVDIFMQCFHGVSKVCESVKVKVFAWHFGEDTKIIDGKFLSKVAIKMILVERLVQARETLVFLPIRLLHYAQFYGNNRMLHLRSGFLAGRKEFRHKKVELLYFCSVCVCQTMMVVCDATTTSKVLH